MKPKRFFIMEIWKEIPGYEGLYLASNNGRIKSVDRYYIRRGHKIKMKGRILRQIMGTGGYYRVTLSSNCRIKTFLVHRLVASSFISNKINRPEVNHLNGIKTDNNADNLMWVTRQENIEHAIRTGLCNNRGQKNGRSKLKYEDVLDIKHMFYEGYRISEICKKYSVSRACIADIKNNKNWKHVRI